MASRAGANCGLNEDKDNLFVQFAFYGKIWHHIDSWLGFSTAFNDNLMAYLLQFGGLRGFSNKVRYSLNMIWNVVVWVIWKEWNRRIFQNKEENIQTLCERVMLLFFWWLKLKYVAFDYDYQFWWLNPILCFSTVI
jgi:hypothetical protein